MTDIVIPLPTPRPDMGTYASIAPSDQLPPDKTAEPVDKTTRQVRTVGPVFLPGE